MNYKKFSAVLSFVISIIVLLFLIALVFFGPVMFKTYMVNRMPSVTSEVNTKILKVFCIVLYSCLPFGFLSVFCLLKLLYNIVKEIPFKQVNVTYIHVIAWSCILVSAINVVGAFFFLPLVFVAAASGFLGVMLHVVKYVIQSAVVLKEDNDLTI